MVAALTGRGNGVVLAVGSAEPRQVVDGIAPGLLLLAPAVSASLACAVVALRRLPTAR